ncbi:MAG: hypothetical protein IIA59_01375 [Candidatus Marinimicrobia bacterium]|nr:hypothetical protein [Candidatus Neomarinimicrobiota bacterium]
MARQYSNKTTDALAHFIANNNSTPGIRSLFLAVSVPSELDDGTSKLDRALNVCINLANNQVANASAIFNDLMSEAVYRSRDLLNSDFSGHEECVRLVQCLRSDGYDIQNGEIVGFDFPDEQVTEEVSVIEQRLKSRGMDDVAIHMDQAHQNYIDQNYEASNAMLRSALEGTINHIAIIKAGSEAYIPRSNPKFLAPRDYRNYLEVSGFLESDEMDLLNRFYGYASQDGSHPGISSEPECRLRRLFTIALVQYLLEKLE